MPAQLTGNGVTVPWFSSELGDVEPSKPAVQSAQGEEVAAVRSADGCACYAGASTSWR